jgi:hypothetical protein
MRRFILLAFGLAVADPALAADPLPLTLENKIPLTDVHGRIDHMAFDREHELLFVAELSNDSVDVLDVKQRRMLHRLTGLKEPQGVAYHPGTATLYVANAADGSVRLYQAPEFKPVGSINLGRDADNIRLDARRNRIVVGYGDGGLALIDPTSRKKVGDIPLKAHPEGYQFDASGQRIFVNLPDAHMIGVVDVDAGAQSNKIDTAGARSNFPMAVDADMNRLLSVFRSPRKLMAFGTEDGKLAAAVDTCGDADDVFVDGPRKRIYISCGEGLIDVFAIVSNGYERIARLPTVPGARTSLYEPTTDRLYLGVRAGAGEASAIWVFKPQ